MALHIDNREVEDLAAQVAEMAHETEIEAVRRSLEERKLRLTFRGQDHGSEPKRDVRQYLEEHVWPFIPPEARDKPPMTREEEDEILGYGPEGY